MKYILVHEPTKQIIDSGCHKNLNDKGDNGPDIISKAKNKYDDHNNTKTDINDFSIYVPYDKHNNNPDAYLNINQ